MACVELPHVRLLLSHSDIPLLKASVERKHSQFLGMKLLTSREHVCGDPVCACGSWVGKVSSRVILGWTEHPFSRRGATAAERGSLAQLCSAPGSTPGRNTGNELQKLLCVFLRALMGNRD